MAEWLSEELMFQGTRDSQLHCKDVCRFPRKVCAQGLGSQQWVMTSWESLGFLVINFFLCQVRGLYYIFLNSFKISEEWMRIQKPLRNRLGLNVQINSQQAEMSTYWRGGREITPWHGDFDVEARQPFAGFIAEMIRCVCANLFFIQLCGRHIYLLGTDESALKHDTNNFGPS